MIRRVLLAFLVTLASTCALAQEFKPYPKARITPEEWQSYFAEVSQKHGARKQESPREPLVIFANAEGRTLYAFTKDGHPAHPAIINRQVVQQGDGIYVDQVGYFAGDEAAFAKLSRAFEQLNAQMREYMKRQAEKGR